MTIPKKHDRAGNTNLFFVEMIIDLLFFTVSAVIILRAFAAADMTAKKSAVSENVVLCAQSAAEVYSAYGDIEKMTGEVFGKSFAPDSNGHCTVLLDTSCHISASPKGVVMLMSELREENKSGTMSRLIMRFVYSGEELYQIECAAYMPNGNGGAA